MTQTDTVYKPSLVTLFIIIFIFISIIFVFRPISIQDSSVQ